jgi:MFS family permease
MLLIGRVHYVVIVILLSLVVMIMSAASLFTTSYISARFNKWGKGATVAGILNASASLGVVAANTLFTGLADTVGWYGTITVWLVIMVISLVIAAINIPMWTKFLKSR